MIPSRNVRIEGRQRGRKGRESVYVRRRVLHADDRSLEDGTFTMRREWYFEWEGQLDVGWASSRRMWFGLRISSNVVRLPIASIPTSTSACHHILICNFISSMLREDLFDENGILLAGGDHLETIQPDFQTGLSSLSSLTPNMSTYFQIPNDVLQRMVKNKFELTLLKRLGDLSVELDSHIANILHSGSKRRHSSRVRSYIVYSAPFSLVWTWKPCR